MTIERLDWCGGDAIAYLPAETAAGQSFVHSPPPSLAVPVASQKHGACSMTFDVVVIQPLVALIAGILILLIPRLLNFVVAIYLILIGLVGLWPRLIYHVPQ
jgi:Protein of unknown function (DUF3096)